MVAQTFSVKAIAAILSFSVANAHMIMKTPIPYGRGVINNSPLDQSGSDFPCKNIFDMTDPVNDVNHLVPGESNTLSFTGSAVHGGGSCQVSLTKDLKPTKSSKWMVIKSIEGGCPASVEGNLPADPNGSGASTFEYKVPEGIDDGEYTIAWTWFNKVGNREMYMNCGRASIAKAKKRYAPAQPRPAVEARQASFPDLFTANLDIFQCKVPDNTNVQFPNPAADNQIVAGATLTPPTGSCGGSGSSPAAAPAPAGSSAAASGAASASAPASSAAASGFATGSPATGNPGVFATGAASAAPTAAASGFATGAAPSAAATPSASVAPIPAAPSAASAAPVAAPSASAAAPPAPAPASGSTSQGTACTPEGAYMCSSDGTAFQRCASGIWSAPISMAAGTSCTPGQSTNLNMKVGRRSFQERRANMPAI